MYHHYSANLDNTEVLGFSLDRTVAYTSSMYVYDTPAFTHTNTSGTYVYAVYTYGIYSAFKSACANIMYACIQL